MDQRTTKRVYVFIPITTIGDLYYQIIAQINICAGAIIDFQIFIVATAFRLFREKQVTISYLCCIGTDYCCGVRNRHFSDCVKAIFLTNGSFHFK